MRSISPFLHMIKLLLMPLARTGIPSQWHNQSHIESSMRLLCE